MQTSRFHLIHKKSSHPPYSLSSAVSGNRSHIPCSSSQELNGYIHLTDWFFRFWQIRKSHSNTSHEALSRKALHPRHDNRSGAQTDPLPFPKISPASGTLSRPVFPESQESSLHIFPSTACASFCIRCRSAPFFDNHFPQEQPVQSEIPEPALSIL